ncbi:hypothetical protein WN944_014673 [Citrus x changshan-huyou]|uniref:Uncharacterized protein n=1 Tax=Citrus x changshan-huyou TaxID=2935761 RepID=A0AAP0M8A3_9ROSI
MHLPPIAKAFFRVTLMFFQSVFDVKVVAGYFSGLRRPELGLSRLARILNVKRYRGLTRQGSDGLLTVAVFAEMKIALSSKKVCLMGSCKEGFKN